MEPASDWNDSDVDSDCESPMGTWFYNQGRSCYTVSVSEEDELCFSQQMASGTVLRGVLATPTPEAAESPPASEEPPWVWEALLSNQARIRLRREGSQMVSSYRRPSSEGWTVPQRSCKRLRPTEAEREADRAARLRQLLASEPIECGGAGRPLGLCRQCCHCAGWTGAELEPRRRELFVAAAALFEGAGQQEVREARGRELHSLCDPVPSFDGVRFDFVKGHWDWQGHRTESKLPCGRCGCPEHMHEDVSRKLGRFVSNKGHSFRTNIPLAALRWTQLELALWGDTGGLFKPTAPGLRRDRSSGSKAGAPLVSVICPTTASRRCFHPFLWSCFRSQTLESRELVIIETSEDGPSPFFEEKARLDSSVVYKYYHVPPWQWSIGVKRNLACYFASGQVIAHFDDDDLYAPIYLEEMMKCLRDPREAFVLHAQQKLGENLKLNMLLGLGLSTDLKKISPPEAGSAVLPALDEETVQSTIEGFGAALAKLSSWHTFSIQKQGWGFFDAVGGDDEPLMDVSNSLYGWGFSMVYLRRAWEMSPFLHMNLGEDYDFVKSFRKLNFPVILVPDRRGICAHTHHADNTAGGLEFADYGRAATLLYSPLGGMITGYTCAVKALQSVQEQQLEEGKSRRNAEGKLRDINTDTAPNNQEAASTAEPGPPATETPPAPEEPKARPPRPPAAPRRAEAPALPQQAPPPCRFSIISSVDNFKSKEDMEWDGGSFRYSGPQAVVGERIQLLKNGQREAALYPSVPDADLDTAHFLRGPDGRGQGCCWRLAPPGGGGDRGPCEVVLNCPEGWPLSLSWTCGANAAGQRADTAGRLARGAQVGRWKLLWELGEMQQAGGAAFMAEAEGGQRAMVTQPASLPALQHLAAMRGVPGVPPLLDCGATAGRGVFQATPALGDSLDQILERCDHDGHGGRMPWVAVQCLGHMLLSALRGLHARGLVLGGLSPRGVCVQAQDGQAFLVDFSLSRPIWAEATPDLESANSECDSINAGFSGDRRPADDLESLGWLLWRCVVGPLPWARLAAAGGSETGDDRRCLRERVARAKREFCRAGCSVFGQRYQYCPPELDAYLRGVRGINDLGGLKAGKYDELLRLLEAPDSRQAWEDVVSGRRRERFRAGGGRVLWRAAGSSSSADAELVAGSGAFGLASTGRSELLHGGRWAEVERVWVPGAPRRLLECRGWALVADWAGPLLEPLPAAGAAAAAAPELTEEDWLTAVLGPLRRRKKPSKPSEGARPQQEERAAESEEEEADVRERERQMMDIAADVARKYVKAREQVPLPQTIASH